MSILNHGCPSNLIRSLLPPPTSLTALHMQRHCLKMNPHLKNLGFKALLSWKTGSCQRRLAAQQGGQGAAAHGRLTRGSCPGGALPVQGRHPGQRNQDRKLGCVSDHASSELFNVSLGAANSLPLLPRGRSQSRCGV